MAPDKTSSMNPTRRDVLKVGLTGLGVLSLGSSLPSFLSKTAYAQAEGATTAPALSSDNILVVVQLTGGNDGLNTVIPFASDEYAKARPTIRVKDRYHKLDDALALNPGLADFKKLFDEGKLAVVNGCGYPSPSRSHFRSMEVWHTANPAESQAVGWLGHWLDHALRGSENPVSAVNIGAELPQALVCDGPPVPSLGNIGDFGVRFDQATPYDKDLELTLIRGVNAVRTDGGDPPALAMLKRQATNAMVASEQLRKLTQGYKPAVPYPGGPLAPQLLTIAQIIAAEVGTRLFYCQVGGFDTHANQVGGHEGLLRQVAQAVGVFQADLEAKGYAGKVVTLLFSEFGRRVAENASLGTDHGAAGPVFLVGSKVKAGVHGAYPSLTELDTGDLKYTTDFRCVYASILRGWLNTDPAAVLNGSFAPVGVL